MSVGWLSRHSLGQVGSACTMWRPWTGHPAGRWGSKTGQPCQGLGSSKEAAVLLAARRWSPSSRRSQRGLGGRGKEAVLSPSHDPGRNRGGGRAQEGGTDRESGTRDSSHPGSRLQSPLWSEVCLSFLHVWVSPEQPVLCCVPMLSEDSRIPSFHLSFPFRSPFSCPLWFSWFSKVPG